MTARTSRPPRLLAAGYTTLDTVRHNGRIAHRAGGTAANVAAILAWLGWDTQLAAGIGADPAARCLSAELKGLGVGLDLLTHDPETRTPQVIHEIENGSHHFLFRCPECGRRFPRSRPLSKARAAAALDALDDVDVFFFDRANPGTLNLADGLRNRGALVVFEPSAAGRSATMERAAELAQIIKLSDDRLSVLWSALPAPTPNQVQVVTRGEHGAVARIGEGAWVESTAFAADTVDPGGAGDWTTAGLLYQVRADKEFDEHDLVGALRLGQALAALNCEWPGARGLIDHATPSEALSEAKRLLGAKPRRRPTPARRRRARHRSNTCGACLDPHPVQRDTTAIRLAAQP
jgi:fructokinase